MDAVQMQLPGVTPAVAPSMKRGAPGRSACGEKNPPENLLVMGCIQELGGRLNKSFPKKKICRQIQRQTSLYIVSSRRSIGFFRIFEFNL